MSVDGLDLYRRYMQNDIDKNKCHDKHYPQVSFSETVQRSPAYHCDAMVNGKSQPIVATRTDMKKCSVTVIPGSTLNIGDLVEVFNEHWICVELYCDEVDMTYGVLWLCNQVFHYQDHSLNTIQKYAVLDDGSYSNGADKAFKVTDNSFDCYISLDEESKALYVDKRLAIDLIYDSRGDGILEVGKIKWIDTKSKNFGKGSHLMVFGILDDPYNPETDNVNKLICDYKEQETEVVPDTGEDEPEGASSEMEAIGRLLIDGRKTLRAGSGRTYTVIAIDDRDGNAVDIDDESLYWTIECDLSGVDIESGGTKCVASVKEDANLIGEMFTLKCEDVSGKFAPAEYVVEVI